ncbi:MAG: 1-acyl-sn-glycerol-3-phosphate acyltransferase [Lewinellaceae bacterium]|nr:1-acyl-sn-glycerol-3-phosphate acyltransferase [Lewinellaceae bacterium]
MAYRNIRLHPILRLLYFFFRTLAWLGVGVFFRRRVVLGEEYFHFDGPAIVVTNHPSTLMDVFNPGLPVRQEMFFLANYGLFKHPVSNWLLSRLFCIPVKRREDVAEGETRDNNAAFKRSFMHLEQHGVLFIAAEGTSWMNRWVREFKTGAARIALGTEARNNWQLGVKILPVGLSYSAPHLFRSDVVVQGGEPLNVADWREIWEKNPELAVLSVTQELRRRVTAQCIDTRDEEGEIFIGQLEEIWRNERPLDLRGTFFRSKDFTDRLLDNAALRTTTNRYFEDLQASGVSDSGLAALAQAGPLPKRAFESLLLILGFPLFAAGYLFWFLPCFLPWWLNKKMDLYVGYSSTVKMLAGLIAFPLALWAAARFIPPVFGWQHAGIPVALSVIALGLFAERYLDRIRRARARMGAARLLSSHPEKFDALMARRNDILEASR